MKSNIITLAQLSSTGDPAYAGPASPSTVVDNFIKYNTFLFNNIPSKGVELVLPSKSDIFLRYGLSDVIKTIHFLVAQDADVFVIIKGVSEGVIVDSKGELLGEGSHGSIKLNASGYITLYYTQGVYTCQSESNLVKMATQNEQPSTKSIDIEIGESMSYQEDIVSNSVPNDAVSFQGLFINKKKQGFNEVRQRTDIYFSYSDWENAGSPQPANFYFIWDEELQTEELDRIEVAVSWLEFVPSRYSVNYGVLSTVDGAETNIAFEAIKGKIKATSGGVVSWDTDYIGAAYTSVIEDKIHLTNTFLFTSISTSTLIVRLPSSSHIAAKTSVSTVSFLLHITIGYATSNIVRLMSVTNGQLVNNNGANVPYIDLAKCDSIILNYTNGAYYVMSIQQ